MIQAKNSNDIFIRSAIAGLLDLLNRNVTIVQTVAGVEGTYDVKFYYNFGQDEQFMKDFFIEYTHGCKLYEHAEGNFDVRPVGVVKFETFSIRPSDMTNRFVRGTFINEGYTSNMEKQLKAYSAYLMRLPMTIKLKVDVQCDGLGQALRIMESILTAVYKSNVMYFQYMGLRVPSEILMADAIDIDKKVEFTYDDSQIAHARFDVDINTTFPIFDEQSTAFKSNIIREFRLNLENEQHIVDEHTFIEGVVEREFPLPYDLTIEI